jgi:hypothetical protein
MPNLSQPVTPPYPLPRFRALALFGRRPPERAVKLSLPASENLHSNGLMHRSKQRKKKDRLAAAFPKCNQVS